MFVDTSYCVDLMREQNRSECGPATLKLQSLGSIPIMASVFVICELQAGARMSAHPKRELQRVEILADNLRIVYPDTSFPVAYGETEALLRKQGYPIPTMDLLIGVTARIHGLVLLTRDSSHYKLIPDLVVESY